MRSLSQARFLGRVLGWVLREQIPSPGSRAERGPVVAKLEEAFLAEWRRAGMDGFDRELRGDLAPVRFLDVLAAVNRLRPEAQGERGRT
jgi:hypothetical protein